MTYNTRPSEYPGLWPPYAKFKRSAPCVSTFWYVLLLSYGFRYIVRCRKVILLGGSVHINTALYGSIYSTARSRFIIHWHMKYADKVPCKSYILFCIMYIRTHNSIIEHINMSTYTVHSSWTWRKVAITPDTLKDVYCMSWSDYISHIVGT